MMKERIIESLDEQDQQDNEVIKQVHNVLTSLEIEEVGLVESLDKNRLYYITMRPDENNLYIEKYVKSSEVKCDVK